MKEIKDEERIIGRILRGELSFSDHDFINLDKADLSVEREEQLGKLAQEITEVISQNKELRKEVEEKVETAESDTFTKLDLVVIEEELRCLKDDLKRLTYHERGKKLLIGAGVTVAIGLSIPLIVSLFTNSLPILLFACIASYCLGIIPTMASIKKSDNKLKQIKERIVKLEQERLKLLDFKSENMIERDVERTKNLTKHIYNTKDLDKEVENMEIIF